MTTAVEAFSSYETTHPAEGDAGRVRQLLQSGDEPFDRHTPLHLTGSAVVVHVATRRVLLRWHPRQQAWLQVGGHGDAGEDDPFRVALREAREETGLEDLSPWPSSPPRLVHVAVVPVAGAKREPAHEHADFRYVLETASPERARPESEEAPLCWLPLEEAISSSEPNLAETLRRLKVLFAS